MQNSAVEDIVRKSFTDITSSSDNDTILSSLSSSANCSGLSCKMSSDSAFHSIGDSAELEQVERRDAAPEVRHHPPKPEPSRLELQMKAIAEEAKKRRLAKGRSK